MVAAAVAVDPILSEDDRIGAANSRHICSSLFEDEQDWSGILSALEAVLHRLQPNATCRATRSPLIVP